MIRFLTAPERNARKTHCPRGHAYTEENTRWCKNPNHGGMMRQCRECKRMRDREKGRRQRKSAGVKQRPERWITTESIYFDTVTEMLKLVDAEWSRPSGPGIR